MFIIVTMPFVHKINEKLCSACLVYFIGLHFIQLCSDYMHSMFSHLFSSKCIKEIVHLQMRPATSPHIVLVISPLIALMADQKSKLDDLGISCCLIQDRRNMENIAGRYG